MDQMPEFARKEVESCLRDLADRELQEQAWIRGQPGGPASPSELVSQLFDDTALSEYLRKRGDRVVFSNPIDALLVAISELIDQLDLEMSASLLLRKRQWQQVQEKAAEAADLIAALPR
jgi:hypothetical protein